MLGLHRDALAQATPSQKLRGPFSQLRLAPQSPDWRPLVANSSKKDSRGGGGPFAGKKRRSVRIDDQAVAYSARGITGGAVGRGAAVQPTFPTLLTASPLQQCGPGVDSVGQNLLPQWSAGEVMGTADELVRLLDRAPGSSKKELIEKHRQRLLTSRASPSGNRPPTGLETRVAFLNSKVLTDDEKRSRAALLQSSQRSFSRNRGKNAPPPRVELRKKASEKRGNVAPPAMKTNRPGSGVWRAQSASPSSAATESKRKGARLEDTAPVLVECNKAPKQDMGENQIPHDDTRQDDDKSDRSRSFQLSATQSSSRAGSVENNEAFQTCSSTNEAVLAGLGLVEPEVGKEIGDPGETKQVFFDEAAVTPNGATPEASAEEQIRQVIVHLSPGARVVSTSSRELGEASESSCAASSTNVLDGVQWLDEPQDVRSANRRQEKAGRMLQTLRNATSSLRSATAAKAAQYEAAALTTPSSLKKQVRNSNSCRLPAPGAQLESSINSKSPLQVFQPLLSPGLLEAAKDALAAPASASVLKKSKLVLPGRVEVALKRRAKIPSTSVIAPRAIGVDPSSMPEAVAAAMDSPLLRPTTNAHTGQRAVVRSVSPRPEDVSSPRGLRAFPVLSEASMKLIDSRGKWTPDKRLGTAARTLIPRVSVAWIREMSAVDPHASRFCFFPADAEQLSTEELRDIILFFAEMTHAEKSAWRATEGRLSYLRRGLHRSIRESLQEIRRLNDMSHEAQEGRKRWAELFQRSLGLVRERLRSDFRAELAELQRDYEHAAARAADQGWHLAWADFYEAACLRHFTEDRDYFPLEDSEEGGQQRREAGAPDEQADGSDALLQERFTSLHLSDADMPLHNESASADAFRSRQHVPEVGGSRTEAAGRSAGREDIQRAAEQGPSSSSRKQQVAPLQEDGGAQITEVAAFDEQQPPQKQRLLGSLPLASQQRQTDTSATTPGPGR
eukprot:g8530.t1